MSARLSFYGCSHSISFSVFGLNSRNEPENGFFYQKKEEAYDGFLSFVILKEFC
jgi:hypothetical protein